MTYEEAVEAQAYIDGKRTSIPRHLRPNWCKHFVRLKRRQSGEYLSEAAKNWLTQFLGPWDYRGDCYMQGTTFGPPGRNWTITEFGGNSVVVMFECEQDAKAFEFRFGRQANWTPYKS